MGVYKEHIINWTQVCLSQNLCVYLTFDFYYHMYILSNLLALPISVLFVCTKQSVSQEVIWSSIQIRLLYSIYTCARGEMIDWLSVVVHSTTDRWKWWKSSRFIRITNTTKFNNILLFDWSCLSTTHNYKSTNIIVVCLSISNKRSVESIWPWDTRCCISGCWVKGVWNRQCLWVSVNALATGTYINLLDRLYKTRQQWIPTCSSLDRIN